MAAHTARAAWAGNEPDGSYEGRPPASPSARISRFACRSEERGPSIQSERAAVRIVRPLPLPAGHWGAGDALPPNGPIKVSLVSPGFPPQLGGVEVVVRHLADELFGYGHQVTVYAQRPRGSSFSVGRDYPVRWFAD